MLKALKIKIMQFWNRFNTWQFDLFSYRVCVRLKRIPEDKKIVWLSNKLLNEIEGQGISIDNGNAPHIDIWVHSGNEIKVGNILTGFTAKGQRDLTV